MKERQRWTAEEDALLRAYILKHGPREWNLISQRMHTAFHRDSKSCLERWKNYPSPNIKRGSLSNEEQRLVIQLQTKYGNQWKQIATEVPGRTAKRLGKWWEVFKEKQERLKENNTSVAESVEPKKYDHILENFAEKLVRDRENIEIVMSAPIFPSWLSNSNSPPSPNVALTLSPCGDNNRHGVISGPPSADSSLVYDLTECCRELEEGYQALVAHKKETSWRLRRVELQLESEKGSKKREKIEEIEAKIRALREEQVVALDRIDAEYKEQITRLKRDAEAKEQRLAEHWAAKHAKLGKFFEQMNGNQW